MSTTIKMGWLNDKNGDKFAPKTLMSQIQDNEGVLLEDKIQASLDEVVKNNDSTKVGAILTTTRTDLDDTWLLCNGDTLSATEYDELAKLLPMTPTDWVVSKNTGLTDIKCITYANGYWVVGGYRYVDSTYQAAIAYATDYTGTWTTNNLWSGSSTKNAINCITYANGRWAVGGIYYDGSNYYVRIAYATDPTGTWATKNLWSGSSSYNTIRCITYANGYWVVGGCYCNGSNYYARIGYSKNITAWTYKSLSSISGSGNYISCITYANGLWVAGGRYHESSTHYIRIAYTTDLTGTWTTKDLWSGSSSYSYNDINCIAYANGYWVVGGRYADDTDVEYARIAYATDLTGTWITKDLWSGDRQAIYCVTYANGYWVIGGCSYADSTVYATIAYTQRVYGQWAINTLWSASSVLNAIYDITYANGCWAAVGYSNKIAYSNSNTFALPSVSHEYGYTYIKAKEI